MNPAIDRLEAVRAIAANPEQRALLIMAVEKAPYRYFRGDPATLGAPYAICNRGNKAGAFLPIPGAGEKSCVILVA